MLLCIKSTQHNTFKLDRHFVSKFITSISNMLLRSRFVFHKKACMNKKPFLTFHSNQLFWKLVNSYNRFMWSWNLRYFRKTWGDEISYNFRKTWGVEISDTLGKLERLAFMENSRVEIPNLLKKLMANISDIWSIFEGWNPNRPVILCVDKGTTSSRKISNRK